LPLRLLSCFTSLLGSFRIFLYCSKNLFEQIRNSFNFISIQTLLPFTKVCFSLCSISLFDLAPVFVDVCAVNPCRVYFTVLFTFFVAFDLLEAWEFLNRVRDVNTCVNTSFHAPEHFVAGGDAGDADVKLCFERFAQVFLAFGVQSVVVVHHIVSFTVIHFITCVELVESLFLQ